MESLIAQARKMGMTEMANMCAQAIGDKSNPTSLITDYQNLEEFLEFAREKGGIEIALTEVKNSLIEEREALAFRLIHSESLKAVIDVVSLFRERYNSLLKQKIEHSEVFESVKAKTNDNEPLDMFGLEDSKD